jgi:hypothetical protein
MDEGIGNALGERSAVQVPDEYQANGLAILLNCETR